MTILRTLLLAACLLLGLTVSPAAAAAEADSDPVGVWPLQPTHDVVHDFDPPDDPWGAGHRGVDLAGTVGQSVHSALAGTVAFVGKIAGKPAVTISHGDTRTTYEPVSSTLEVGSSVAAGDRIGALELAFSHCFPVACLHWGLLHGDTYLDPLSLVGSGRVRLLPLWRDEPVDHGASARQAPASPYAALPYSAWVPLLRAYLP
ncbi:M23 family metallopeptidase [Nocardioides sp. B-3]|uniref:M23 family metallopeptidase n=1 Tax=Nocardioides sp. B-3 TaxID=2895565 RepID=UPI00215365B4|nr:M23 family metallopeptidase [Nocardioides sp. B-3]UUZ59808.1 M23 family metallopeptidase [Nocardioides sp. B-3]